MTQEALSSLKALGNQLRLQLLETPEFRALTVVDRTISELSEILNSFAPPPPPQSAPQPVEKLWVEPVAAAPSPRPEVQAPKPTPAPVSAQKPAPEPVVTAISVESQEQTPAPAPPPAEKPPAEPAANVTSIKPHLQTRLGPLNSQSRMAKAIADTIAAKAPPLGALSSDGSRFSYPLSAAS